MEEKENNLIDEAIKATTGSAENATQEIILAADSLPDVLPLLPLTERPIFPGMMLPVMLPPGPFAKAAGAAASSDYQAVGLVLTKEAVSMETLPESPELYSYGTAAKILKTESPDGE
ncbi:MAG: LON peptidase substrate-binding domain-containing protein, partial [Deltaproteobacteria bacterium]|nr:LON peptidase substrate-binding domain-containing protein [Deltaproteobacteria bacterium]